MGGGVLDSLQLAPSLTIKGAIEAGWGCHVGARKPAARLSLTCLLRPDGRTWQERGRKEGSG